MLQYLAIAGLLVMLSLEIFVYKVVSKKLSGKTFWAGFVTLISWGVGLAISIFLLAFTWPLFMGMIHGALKLNMHPMIIASSFSVIFLIAIWTLWVFLKTWFEEVWGGEKLKHILTAIAIFCSFYTVIWLTGIASGHGEAWIWAYRSTTTVIFIFTGVAVINWWFFKGQNGLGVAVTYVFCCLATAYASSALGWALFANIKGSIHSLSFFLIFNFGIFWLSFGLSDPSLTMKKRTGYWFITPYFILITIICGYSMFLQARGKLSFVEQEVARLTTSINQKSEDLSRRTAAAGINKVKVDFDNAVKVFEKATTKKDKEVALKNVIAVQKKMDTYHQKQKDVRRAEIVLPEALENTSKWIRSKINDEDSNPPTSVSNNTNQIITMGSSGNFNFILVPEEQMKKWLYVAEGLRYSFSTSNETPYDFYIHYKQTKRIIKVGGSEHRVKIPDRAGPFKLYAGEKKVKVTMLVL